MFVGCMWASEYVELLPTLGLPDTGTNVSTGAHMAFWLPGCRLRHGWLAASVCWVMSCCVMTPIPVMWQQLLLLLCAGHQVLLPPPWSEPHT